MQKTYKIARNVPNVPALESILKDCPFMSLDQVLAYVESMQAAGFNVMAVNVETDRG